jgi:hypothetical protein
MGWVCGMKEGEKVIFESVEGVRSCESERMG